MGQFQERCLEGVLGVLPVAQHPPADAQNHRPVPMHQFLERRLGVVASLGDETVQKLSVRQAPDCPLTEQPADLPEPRARCPAHPSHDRSPL